MYKSNITSVTINQGPSYAGILGRSDFSQLTKIATEYKTAFCLFGQSGKYIIIQNAGQVAVGKILGPALSLIGKITLTLIALMLIIYLFVQKLLVPPPSCFYGWSYHMCL